MSNADAPELAQQQRAHRASWAREQRLALLSLGSRDSPLEQLAHEAEREVRLVLRPAGTQDFHPLRGRPQACRLHQRGFSDAGSTLDQEHRRATIQKLINCRQLALALGQLCHELNLMPGGRPPREFFSRWMSAVGDPRKVSGMERSPRRCRAGSTTRLFPARSKAGAGRMLARMWLTLQTRDII